MNAATRPPIDPEAGAALAQFGPAFSEPVTLESIPAERAARKSRRLTDDDLRRGGAIEFEEHTVPGPSGAPDVSLLVCRPAGHSARAPGVVYLHGGGMIVGDNRTAISTSARLRPSGTRRWTTRPGSGRPEARPNCTSGQAATTGSS